MTQLLISVKNSMEALLALEAGADIIDLKDPNVGALGALNIDETQDIVQAMKGNGLISATVGEQHASLNVLVHDIKVRAAIGIDIIKIVASPLFYSDDFVMHMQTLTNNGIKIVTVFFADEKIDLDLLAKIKQAGFFGAMLDTKIKQHHLLQVQAAEDLKIFTQMCHQFHLQSGFAGSLQPQHIAYLMQFNPTYIGFRGGVCENLARKNALCHSKVIEIKKLLHIHNKTNEKTQESRCLALHS